MRKLYYSYNNNPNDFLTFCIDTTYVNIDPNLNNDYIGNILCQALYSSYIRLLDDLKNKLLRWAFDYDDFYRLRH